MQRAKTPPPPIFVGSEIYRNSSYGAHHPLRVPRVSTVMDLTRALGWLPAAQYRNSPVAKPAVLEAFHTPGYLAALQHVAAHQTTTPDLRARYGLGTPSNPVFDLMFRRPATSVGGVMLAAAHIAQGGIAYVPGGGTHHGMPDRANGFCYLNDPVFAIKALQHHGATRVAYVDIDAHHPDGVVAGCGDETDVLLVSVHEENRWPRTGALQDAGDLGNQFNLPMPAGAGDDAMALARDALILPAVAQFRPDAIVLQCGADALTEDPQSRLCLSNQALWDVVSAVMPLAPRLMVLGGGGYNPWSVGRCWAGVWARLTGQDVPDRLLPAAVDVLAQLRWDGQRRVLSPPAAWTETLADVPRQGDHLAEVASRLHRLTPRLRAG